MTTKSFFLILNRQLTQKWGRVLLASAGIMVGVWAITLTSALSLGLSNTIVTAINSQATAKFFQVYKEESGKTDFFEIQGPPKFLALDPKEINKLQENSDSIAEIVPSETMGIFLHSKEATNETNCLDKEKEFFSKSDGGFTAGFPTNISEADKKDFQAKCLTTSTFSLPFQYFYESNKKNWIGETAKPEKNEIVLCFKCGNLDLNKSLGYEKPEEMVNQTIQMELYKPPSYLKIGSVFDVVSPTRESRTLPKSEKIPMKIVAVIDDRNSNGFSFTGNSNNTWVNFDYYLESAKKAYPDKSIDELGFVEYNVYIKDYSKLSKAMDTFKDNGYLAFSISKTLISGIEVAFVVLTWVLAGFGLIAMIASVFGIINVMTISVLERKKEIGILKALGARDGDIFKIFLLESTLLGFFGWLLGTLVSLAIGFGITAIFEITKNNSQSIKDGLESLNITSFSPVFEWWLLVGTLFIALLFTALSGIFPALRASKQNPVDVLRSE
jgi:ABC-type antimicrobial peptide transport system permease subunit